MKRIFFSGCKFRAHKMVSPMIAAPNGIECFWFLICAHADQFIQAPQNRADLQIQNCRFWMWNFYGQRETRKKQNNFEKKNPNTKPKQKRKRNNCMGMHQVHSPNCWRTYSFQLVKFHFIFVICWLISVCALPKQRETTKRVRIVVNCVWIERFLHIGNCFYVN